MQIAFDLLRQLALRHRLVDLYVFGSSITANRPPADIDLVAVYVTREALKSFEKDLDDLRLPLIDLISFAREEWDGSDFSTLFAARSIHAVPVGESGRFKDSTRRWLNHSDIA